MWEDEALDVRFRDMRISECGVIIEVKAKSFYSGFQEAMRPVVEFDYVRNFTEK
jgi:hypothetical protein